MNTIKFPSNTIINNLKYSDFTSEKSKIHQAKTGIPEVNGKFINQPLGQ